MKVYLTSLKTGIQRTKEFEKKKLASYSVNIGTKCGHDCLYCSTGAMLRMHPSFKEASESPFGFGYAIIDPSTPDRVRRDAKAISRRGLVQVCTVVDAWAPEAREHKIGRRCLEAILAEPGWTVRILTKNAQVMEDFDVIERHRDRVLVGLSITATPAKADIIKTLEPNASSIGERIKAMEEAARRGLRTYAMFCPLLPGIADSPPDVEVLVGLAGSWGAEEVFVEPVNARGPGLRLCQEALSRAGFQAEATAVHEIRKASNWSHYVMRLLAEVQQSARRYIGVEKLRFLLYPSRLLPEHADHIRRDDAGVIWLEKK
jgi:DNA repair photolyase